MYLDTPYKISYDTHQYPFKQIVSEILEISENTISSLEELHTLQHYDIVVKGKDQSTIWHKKYYQKFKEDFYPTYLELIKELKYKFNYNNIIYQSIPTFRVQLANGNLAVAEWHKDTLYNHSKGEVNFWMPFTNTNDYNTIWIESKKDSGDYTPYKVNYGEILVFDGTNLMHGNKPNISNQTRVSVDFRLVDPNKFISNESTSINTNIKMNIGGYFEQL
jgi:ectoine hydroxylase-related dioxygenase (phytanoyl-CoA dioxygenase family)